MPLTNRKLWRAVRILALYGAWAGCSFLGAMEKHWIAHEAEVIVVGTLNPSPIWPWFDGWHINGVITIDEVLYGSPLPRQIRLQLVGRWEVCQWWPPPYLSPIMLQKALWFLKRINQNTWEPVSNGSGFRFFSERADWENYIRLNKR